ncbi:hypothetical protein B0H16DRAFT_154352 [Mycena metata]|uniref:Cysteine protease n=1 Tax=Mycena metata TaxID=1033252 RepID=A0AAD7I513_9AGAR|nr:hypothetical protein B0H16DRAFT_154352 [Mycena metata]
MLRTGQSLLAVALGRVREPPLTPTPPVPFPPQTLAAHALHARLLSWFLDASAAPFGVHRMALAGNAAGKDVGMWFGPSAAVGVLSWNARGRLPHLQPRRLRRHRRYLLPNRRFRRPSSSHGHGSVSSSSSHGHGRGSTSSSAYTPGSGARRKEKDGGKEETKPWGDRPVLLLLRIKLKIKSVNPVYYETLSYSTCSPNPSVSRVADPRPHITSSAPRATDSSTSTPTTLAPRSRSAPSSASLSSRRTGAHLRRRQRPPALMTGAPSLPRRTCAADL